MKPPAPAWYHFETTVDKVATDVVRALRGIIPPGFRGVITLTVDKGVLTPHDVSITGRPRQGTPERDDVK